MNKRKNLWVLVSAGIAVCTIWAVSSQNKSFSLERLLEKIQDMNDLLLLPAVLCMFGFIFFEGMAVIRISRSLGYKRNPLQGILYGASDIYFSAITPSASGGQPASAYFMVRDGMRMTTVTSVLLLNLVLYSTALLIIGAVTLILYGGVLAQVSLGFQILFGLGACVLIGLTILFYLLLKHEKILYGLMDKVLHLLAKLHLLKHAEKKRESLLDSMQHFRECADLMAKDRKMVAAALLYNLLQRLSQLGVTFFIFLASGRSLQTSLHAMAMQCFVVVGSNSLPVPGGMGVADYMMLDGFTLLIGEIPAVDMELLCRGLTFYSCVLTGGILTAVGYLLVKRRTR